MSCTLSYTINPTVNAEEAATALLATVSSSFSVPVSASVNAQLHSNATPSLLSGLNPKVPYVFLNAKANASLNAEISQSAFVICGRFIKSANPTTITVDNLNIDIDTTLLFIDTNNP